MSNTENTPNTENVLSEADILRMQAIEAYNKTNKPRVKSADVLLEVTKFVNSNEKSRKLSIKFNGREQTFKKVIKAHNELLGRVWMISDDDNAVTLVNISAKPDAA